MGFGEVDKKILTSLYHNSREPLSKIAKSCGVSREQAEYRVKKFENNGLIKKYLTVFNYGLLGFNEFVVIWLKVRGKKSLIKNELKKCRNLLSVGEVLNGFDLYADFVFKDKFSFESYFNNFLSENKEFIAGHDIFISTSVEIYPLKSFGKKTNELNYSLIGGFEEVKLSENDWKILSKLDANGRVSSFEISSSVKMTAEGVSYGIKQLKKKGIIIGSRILFDMEKAGFYFAGLRLKLQEVSESVRKKLTDFCRSHKNINALSFGLGNYNSFVQFFYQKEEELRNVISDFRKSFDDLILKSELLLIENEEHIRMLPLK